MNQIKKLSSFDIIKRRNNDQPPPLHSIVTDLEIVVDKSGSMNTMQDVPAEQIHQLIKDQHKLAIDEGRKITISVTVFDNTANTVIDNVDLSNPNYVIPTYEEVRLMLSPNGLTRFYDTILERVASQKARSKAIRKALPYSIRCLNPRINRVLYVLTDGEDNQSSMGMQHLRKCLNTQKAQGDFTPVFLAANIGDAEIVGEQMGFDADTSLTIGNTPQFASVGMNHANSLLRAVSGGSAPPPFTQTMRQTSYAPPPPSAAALAAGFMSDDSDDQDTFQLTSPPRLRRGQRVNLRTLARSGGLPPPIRYNLRR